MVVQVKTAEEFKQKISSGTTIVDFTATWCGPCQVIGPIFTLLANDYPTIKFIKVDVDQLADVSGEQGVAAMPSFFVYKNGVKVDELVGASQPQLEALLKKHA